MSCSRFAAVNRVAIFLAAGAIAWLACGAQAAEALPAPVAYWPLDEGQGLTARDATGKGHHLTLVAPQWTEGVVGEALCFDGKTTRASAAPSDDFRLTKEVSVEAWVMLRRFPANTEGIGLVNAGTSYLLRISGQNPSFHIFTDGWGPVMAPGAIQTGRWYHLVGTYDGRRMCIYVKLAAARRRTGDIAASDQPLILGRQVSPLIGCLDEVKIYPRALTAEQVAASFAETKAKMKASVKLGRLTEPFEELFGPTRHNPAPLATLDHLPAADLTFCVITDTHIGAPGEEGRFCHTWRVEETIRQINALRPAFVMHCGDIITAFPFHAQYEDQCRNAVRLLKRFEMPYHLVAGNHDIGNQRNMRVWDDKWLGRIHRTLEDMLITPARRQVYMKYFGKDFYSFQQGGCYFIVFDDELCNSGLPVEKEQEQWLEEELRKAQGSRAVFLFTHNPLFWAEPDEPGPKNYEPVLEPARSRLLALLRRYKVTAVYTGHTHFAFTNEYHGAHLRTLNSTTFNRNFAGINQHMSGEAQIYDPHKLGFLVVRVRGTDVHESWVPLYWRVPEPPAELKKFAGPRLVGRPATETDVGILGVAAPAPQVIKGARDGRAVVNDHRWRLGEELGSALLEVPRVPGSDEEWAALERGLTLGRLRGTQIVVPLPADEESMKQAWARLKPCADAIAAVVVLNGAPSNPAAPLTSWKPHGTPADWAGACSRARELVGPDIKIILARLPLLGAGALDDIKSAIAQLEGKADALALWMSVQDAPEKDVLPALTEAARIAARHGRMGLMLDAACWQRVDEPLRSAYMLRLLALAQSHDVPILWWIGADDAGGLLDSHLDPTPLFYAVQSWQAFALAKRSTDTARLELSAGLAVLRWTDNKGQKYLAWWRPATDTTIAPSDRSPTIPAGALIADPLHGRLLKRPPSGKLPCCPWPLVARWK